MKRILVDQDGVLADTMGRAFEVIRAERGIEICHADVIDYWFNGMDVDPKVFIEIFRREGFYRSLDVITGAVGAIRRLRRDFEVVVCSAPISGAEHCEEDKRLWLEELFDKDFAEQAIITPDKHAVDGDLIIEDNPHVDEKPASWKTVMFAQRWNEHRTDLPRMQGWFDLGVIYKELEGNNNGRV